MAAFALAAGTLLGLTGTASADPTSVSVDMCVGGGGTLISSDEGAHLTCIGGWFNGFPVVV
ncbi:hypothetical protein GCM10023214_30600 [Amycolatopsis dongchuanensis]|uniref:Secreted protein n=1 Tax=Amycolatopsis dongchuanensis TaxID=1070866 RepID=A0ABP9QJE9_9PSEU|nr:hypothetical protein [Amycolatopsis sacchari]